MNKLKYFLYYWVPTLLWASLIFYLSSLSSLPSAQKIWWDYIFKKSAHMFVYAVLYFLIIRAFGHKTKKYYIRAFILCILYSASDEYHQSFTPGRHPMITDVGFDTIGMTVTYLRLNHHI